MRFFYAMRFYFFAMYVGGCSVVMGYELCFYISLKIEKLYPVLDINGKDGPRQPSYDLINGYRGKCDLKGAKRIVNLL